MAIGGRCGAGAAMTSPQARMAGNRGREGWPQTVRKAPVVDRDEEPFGYVVHVPVLAADLGAAVEIGRLVVTALRHLPAVQVGCASVSPDGRPDRYRAVCCNRRLTGDARCLLPPGHPATCAGER